MLKHTKKLALVLLDGRLVAKKGLGGNAFLVKSFALLGKFSNPTKGGKGVNLVSFYPLKLGFVPSKHFAPATDLLRLPKKVRKFHMKFQNFKKISSKFRK